MITRPVKGSATASQHAAYLGARRDSSFLIWVGSAWAVAILLFVLVSLSFALSTSLTALMAFDALNIPGIEELRKAIEWMGALADTLSYTGLGNDY